MPVGLAGAAAAKTAHHLIVSDVDQEDRRHRPAQLAELRVERLRLGGRAGKAIEDEAVARLARVDPLGDHSDDHPVGHQVAAVHVLLRRPPQLGFVAHRAAENVPGRVVGQPQVFVEALPLSSLA